MPVDNEVAPVQAVDRDRRQRTAAAAGDPHQLPATARPAGWSKGVVKRDSLLWLDGSDDRVKRNWLNTQMTATCRLLELTGKQLESTRRPLAERLSAPLPNEPLERVLRIGAKKPGDRKRVVDHQGHCDETGHQRQQRRAKHRASGRDARQQEHDHHAWSGVVQ